MALPRIAELQRTLSSAVHGPTRRGRNTQNMKNTLPTMQLWGADFLQRLCRLLGVFCLGHGNSSFGNETFGQSFGVKTLLNRHRNPKFSIRVFSSVQGFGPQLLWRTPWGCGVTSKGTRKSAIFLPFGWVVGVRAPFAHESARAHCA